MGALSRKATLLGLFCLPSEKKNSKNKNKMFELGACFPFRDDVFSERTWCAGKQNVTKTCLYNFDPLKPHFYIVKLGFTGEYIIFLISAQKLWVFLPINCGYSLEPPRRDGSNEYPQSMF